jgi:hypothetical protein
MSVSIVESGMKFGEYASQDVFEFERILSAMKLNEHVSKVEFIVRTGSGKKSAVAFVEAKSSIPRSSDEFFSDVCQKFMHSLVVWFAAVCGRHESLSSLLPGNLKLLTHLKLPIKLILVLPTVPDDKLQQMSDKMRKMLISEQKIWGINSFDINVINQSRAEKFGLIGRFCP